MLGSYLTRDLHTAKISSLESVVRAIRTKKKVNFELGEEIEIVTGVERKGVFDSKLITAYMWESRHTAILNHFTSPIRYFQELAEIL